VHLLTRPRRALLLALSLASAACHSTTRTTGASSINPDPPMPSTMESATTPDAATALDAAGADGGNAGALRLLADSNNALGLDVYQAVRRGRTNVALSPLSISIALTMTWAGARGETGDQMKRVLHLDGSRDSVLDGEARALAWARDPSLGVTLRIANRLFGAKSFAFQRPFLDQTNATFGAPLEPLDFAGAADASRQHINDWIATQTDQHIQNLIPRNGVSGATRLVLTNAIYFLGAWSHPFRPDQTKPAPFHLSTTRTKNVPTMHEREQLSFAHADGVKVLQLPYAGGQLAMTFVLPDAIDGLDAVEARLSPATLAAWVGALGSARVNVALPSFTVDPPDALALGAALASLGMPLAFDRAKADFTGIAEGPRPDERIFLGDVFHKAFVKVNEQGTEAAAATGVTMRTMMARREAPPEEFTADHPFLFFLRDVASGTVLFLGRVGDPG
jgi:serpin B